MLEEFWDPFFVQHAQNRASDRIRLLIGFRYANLRGRTVEEASQHERDADKVLPLIRCPDPLLESGLRSAPGFLLRF